jgi:hypothetical protein
MNIAVVAEAGGIWGLLCSSGFLFHSVSGDVANEISLIIKKESMRGAAGETDMRQKGASWGEQNTEDMERGYR